MEITVKITDEIAARAKERELKAEAYTEEILAQQVGAQPSGIRRPETAAEIRAWLDSLARFSDEIPPLPETISRGWIYQEHNQIAIASCLADANILLRITRRSDPQPTMVDAALARRAGQGARL